MNPFANDVQDLFKIAELLFNINKTRIMPVHGLGAELAGPLCHVLPGHDPQLLRISVELQ